MGDFKILIKPDFLNFGIQILATLVLFFMLRKFLFKPVHENLDKRRAYIEGNISDSEKAKEESALLKASYEEKLLEARTEASEIVANARKSGEDLKAKALMESKEEAKRVYDKNMEELSREKQNLMKNMNDEIVDIALLAAEKVLDEKVDKKANEKMVASFIEKMEAGNE